MKFAEVANLARSIKNASFWIKNKVFNVVPFRVKTVQFAKMDKSVQLILVGPCVLEIKTTIVI